MKGLIAGIDPGLNGAIAFVDLVDGAVIAVHDMPVLVLERNKKNKREIDTHGLVRLITDALPEHVFIEQIWGRPHTDQGGYASAPLLISYGICLGIVVAVGIPLTLVPPQRWTKTMGVPAGGDDAGRARASQLLPGAAHLWPYKKNHGRADAALIASYGLRELGRPPGRASRASASSSIGTPETSLVYSEAGVSSQNLAAVPGKAGRRPL